MPGGRHARRALFDKVDVNARVQFAYDPLLGALSISRGGEELVGSGTTCGYQHLWMSTEVTLTMQRELDTVMPICANCV